MRGRRFVRSLFVGYYLNAWDEIFIDLLMIQIWVINYLLINDTQTTKY